MKGDTSCEMGIKVYQIRFKGVAITIILPFDNQFGCNGYETDYTTIEQFVCLFKVTVGELVSISNIDNYLVCLVFSFDLLFVFIVLWSESYHNP